MNHISSTKSNLSRSSSSSSLSSLARSLEEKAKETKPKKVEVETGLQEAKDPKRVPPETFQVYNGIEQKKMKEGEEPIIQNIMGESFQVTQNGQNPEPVEKTSGGYPRSNFLHLVPPPIHLNLPIITYGIPQLDMQQPIRLAQTIQMPQLAQNQQRPVSDILKEIQEINKLDELDELDEDVNIEYYDKTEALFNEAINSIQDKKDLKTVQNKLSTYQNHLKTTPISLAYKDIPSRQVLLADRLHDKMLSLCEAESDETEKQKLKTSFFVFLREYNTALPNMSICDFTQMPTDISKARFLLAQAKLSKLQLMLSYDINMLSGFPLDDIRRIFKVDMLNQMQDIDKEDKERLIQEYFGEGETRDSVKEKAFISLGVIKPTTSGNVETIQTWLKESDISSYLTSQKTKQQQQQLLSCFYPPGDGEQERQIRQQLDKMLDKIELPTKPDLEGKHYDEQRLIWVDDVREIDIDNLLSESLEKHPCLPEPVDENEINEEEKTWVYSDSDSDSDSDLPLESSSLSVKKHLVQKLKQLLVGRVYKDIAKSSAVHLPLPPYPLGEQHRYLPEPVDEISVNPQPETEEVEQYRLTKESAKKVYEEYNEICRNLNLETLFETHNKDFYDFLSEQEKDIQFGMSLAYFLLVDLDERSEEEKKQFFEQQKEKFALLGFSSLENFYATMRGEQDPQ